MCCPRAARLNHNRERERLRICVYFQSGMLRIAIICEHKVIRFQPEDWLSVVGAHKHRDHDQI